MGAEMGAGMSADKGVAPRSSPSPLAGLPFGVKDNIAVEGFRLSCGSRALEGLPAPYTATAVRRLQEAGGVVLGKTNMDEFGMGSSTDTSALGRTHNPWDLSRSAGGSSGGSAAAVAAGMVPYALGSDTGGSVRQPASFCGLYGLKPSYGSVSRWGLVAYASSLEGIGVISADLDLCREAFSVMRGPDPLDQTTVAPAEESGEQEPLRRIGILSGLEGLAPPIEAGYRTAGSELRRLGFEIRELELPSLEYVVPAYYTIAAAEASSNLARYTGIRYGYRNEWAEEPQELVATSRDESLGREVKLRILLGTYVLRSGFQEEYYLRAQKIRTAIRRDFERLFQTVDLLLMPVYPVQAFAHDSSELDPFTQKLADKFTAAANLAGLPALAFPVGQEDGLPVGMQAIAPMFREERLFRAARAYRSIYEPRLAPGAAAGPAGASGEKEAQR
jgi:aspartyl-tRNA(Asn)/glutamyl-tRNA(Gln) amidotransferase subunit A